MLISSRCEKIFSLHIHERTVLLFNWLPPLFFFKSKKSLSSLNKRQSRNKKAQGRKSEKRVFNFVSKRASLWGDTNGHWRKDTFRSRGGDHRGHLESQRFERAPLNAPFACCYICTDVFTTTWYAAWLRPTCSTRAPQGVERNPQRWPTPIFSSQHQDAREHRVSINWLQPL